MSRSRLKEKLSNPNAATNLAALTVVGVAVLVIIGNIAYIVMS